MTVWTDASALEDGELHSEADPGLWMALAAMFVLLMQAGFLLLEAGRTRTRHSISVAQKNLADLAVCWLVFSAFGFALAFGPPVAPEALGALFGDPSWRWSAEDHGVVFIFQCGFCAAAATIISGAVAERIKYIVYVALIGFVALIIYPVVARMAWGDMLGFGSAGFLGAIGFIDHAGATVVHSLGGWAALAAALTLGRRVDVPRGAESQGHSDVLALGGSLLLLVGWLGFNAGLEAPGSAGFANAMVNTLIAGVCGAAAAASLGAVVDGGHTRPTRGVCGLLGGLVAVTASAAFADRDAAMMIGAGAGVLSIGAAEALRRVGVDDPLDAVAVHGVCGAFGTLLVPFVAPTALLVDGSVLAQFEAQAIGVALVFMLAFGGVYAFLAALTAVTPLRVTEQDERIGLNVAEHGALLGTDSLRLALEERVAPRVDRETAAISPKTDYGFDDGADVAASMNTLLARYEASQAELAAAHARMRDFAATASDFLWETDADFRLRYVSDSYASIAHQPAAAAIGADFFDVLKVRQSETALLKLSLKNGRRFDSVVAQLRSANGDKRLLRLRGAPFFDAAGRLLGLRGGAEDITAQAQAEEKLRKQALHDDLTGVLNRRSLHEHISDLLMAPRRDQSFAIVSFDLDGFKAINDTYGHEAGDLLLISVTGNLKSELRDGDVLGRMGGDEFIVVLNDLTRGSAANEAMEWAERAIAKLKRPHDIGPMVHVGVSAGVRAPESGRESVDQLLQEADQALYHAKENGRGSVFAYDPAFSRKEIDRRALEQAMAAGLVRREFFVEYQAQCDSKTGEVLGFEALVRWRRPGFGSVSPNIFVPVAEDTTLIHDLGAFVLKEAVKTAARWRRTGAAGPDIVISVNVSPKQLKLDDFVEQVRSVLGAEGLPAENLELEITEGVFLDDATSCIKKLSELRAMGISIAIDDFGTGFSSLGYLRHLPLNRLKIDKSFVDSVLDDTNSLAIVDTIIKLGKSLGLSVIAEGVESEAQRVKLDGLGCPQFQGFLRSRPVSADAAEQILRGRAQAAPELAVLSADGRAF